MLRTGYVWCLVLTCGAATGCGNPSVTTNDEGVFGRGGGDGTDAGPDGAGGTSFILEDSGAGGQGGASGGAPPSTACANAVCTPGQRCEEADGGARCVDNECADLNCDATARCEPHPEGGNICASAACGSDVDCPAEEYCDSSGVCQTDTCEPAAARCDGDAVLTCRSNGGEETTPFSCGSSSHFVTSCVDDGTGTAGCSCEGDWDCPAYTDCEVGRCVGTGVVPSCTLPAVAFRDVPPALEIHWGGDSTTNDDAHDGTAAQNPAPWPTYAHVVATPIVANLDDDNGDGLINELDFPEILFTAHAESDPWDQGVLRAIHGGGPNKGADYFSRCGDLLWNEGDPIPATTVCDRATDPDGDSGAPVAVGDIDNDGVPEILQPTDDDTFRVLDNTGALILTSPAWPNGSEGETLAIANLDYVGFAEVIMGRNVYAFDRDATGQLYISHILTGGDSEGMSGEGRYGPMACPADLLPGVPGQEIVVGSALYGVPATWPTCATAPCTGALDTYWDATAVAGQGAQLTGEGFCAVADVWGADLGASPGPSNQPDGVPEIILVDNGDLTILEGATGTIIDDRNLNGGPRGGAPNVDDFDGDGFMEIASALQDFYVVVDLQDSTGAGGACPDWPTPIARIEQPDGSHNTNPARAPGGACSVDADCDASAMCSPSGQCVCLHNGWSRDSDDDSSRMTSSSVFDFNGDGAAEVLYNDECDFRVYEGISGDILYSEISRSRTGIENPVVADVDNDGNAEVIAVMNTQQGGRCDEDTNDGVDPRGPNGIRVFGDPTDTWVSARRIWNQQSYHVVNVTEGGQIPMHAPESWGTFNGRTYNTYRSQPRSFGVAPDLTLVDVGVSSPGAACGTLSSTIDIAFQVRNDGDLRVGPGVTVGFVGIWGGVEQTLLDGSGADLTVTLTGSLEPRASTILTVSFDQANNGESTLPDTLRVIVDRDGAERECVEDNNDLEVSIEEGVESADLRIELGAATRACPNARVATTLFNDGTLPASDVVVRYFAGDPSAGGTALHEETVPGPIEAGDSYTFDATLPNIPKGRTIRVYAVVDPEDAIDECNEGNNRDAANDTVRCDNIIQ